MTGERFIEGKNRQDSDFGEAVPQPVLDVVEPDEALAVLQETGGCDDLSGGLEVEVRSNDA